jgi:hypothetical protein
VVIAAIVLIASIKNGNDWPYPDPAKSKIIDGFVRGTLTLPAKGLCPSARPLKIEP